MADGLVLYPHFQPQVVPGWLDKAWKAPPPRPRPRWTTWCCCRRTPTGWPLPNAKLPDRGDFKTVYGEDIAGRSATGGGPWPKASAWPMSLPNSWRGAPLDARRWPDRLG
jgi:hypothetical protein